MKTICKLSIFTLLAMIFAIATVSPAAATAARPESCQDIRDANPAAPDGDYVIYPNNQVFTVYCHDMAGSPSEYLSLVNTGSGSNFSQYTAGGASPGTDAITHYTKVRLNPQTLLVDVNDKTFTTSTGSIYHGGFGYVTDTDYATAMDCLYGGSSSGQGNVDLRGTPFAVVDTFAPDGYIPAGSAAFSSDDQVVDLQGGGYCGWISPARRPAHNPIFNDVANVLKLKLAPNVSPAADAGGPYLVTVVQDVTFDGSGSSDPNGNPLTEAWTVDGEPRTGNIYTADNVPGIHDVCLVVTDPGGLPSEKACTMVVVYDPTGGFVTGGGWIDSPEGAYTPNDLTAFEANFDSGRPPEFSGNTTTEGVQGYAGLGTGSNVFGGDFLRNGSLPDAKTTLTLSGLPAHDSISLSFLLAIIDSWDAGGCPNAGPDFFNVAVDGVSIFSEVFTNHLICGPQGYIPPAGVELARNLNLGFTVGDPVYYDSAYDMGLDPTFQNIPHTSSTLTVEWFASGTFQGTTDESWAIDNVVVHVADEDVTGKANFGFVSKYNRGATTPTGQTEFQFKAAGLNFHSSSYDWLVVAGQNQAKYKGVGTINGAGNYGFMLTAVDNGSSGDTFRIKIWDIDNGDALVYDNKSIEGDDSYAGTVIGGGNIKVHTK